MSFVNWNPPTGRIAVSSTTPLSNTMTSGCTPANIYENHSLTSLALSQHGFRAGDRVQDEGLYVKSRSLDWRP